jgi:hypothetical protein
METYPIYVGGSFCKTNSVLEVKNPFNNSMVGKTFIAAKQELELSIEKAQKVKTQLRDLQ